MYVCMYVCIFIHKHDFHPFTAVCDITFSTLMSLYTYALFWYLYVHAYLYTSLLIAHEHSYVRSLLVFIFICTCIFIHKPSQRS